MPTSDVTSIPAVINEVWRLRPQSVLELGVGFGKYGVLVREYLDISQGRISPADWKTLIVGVEGFEPYKNIIHSSIYSKMKYTDFSDPVEWEHFINYDLVLMVDSLEHLEKLPGEALLRFLLLNNGRAIISVPAVDCPQGAVNGNEFERHRSRWFGADFEHFGGRLIHRGVCIVYSIPGQRRTTYNAYH